MVDLKTWLSSLHKPTCSTKREAFASLLHLEANFKEITMSASQILTSEHTDLPLLPLRDVVVFPNMVIPLFVVRPRSIKALELAMEPGTNMMLGATTSPGKDDPPTVHLSSNGCFATIPHLPHPPH